MGDGIELTVPRSQDTSSGNADQETARTAQNRNFPLHTLPDANMNEANCFVAGATKFFAGQVRKNPANFLRAPVCLRSNDYFVWHLVDTEIACLEYVSDGFRDDEVFLLSLRWESHELIPYMLPGPLRNRWVIDAYPSHLHLLKYLDSRTEAFPIVRGDGNLLEYVNENFKADKAFVAVAILLQGGRMLEFAVGTLKRDKSFLRDALQHARGDFSWTKFVPRETLMSDEIKALMLQICPPIDTTTEMRAIRPFAPSLMDDAEFIDWLSKGDMNFARIFAFHSAAARHIPRKLLKDSMFSMSLVTIELEAFWYAYIPPEVDPDLGILRKILVYDSRVLTRIDKKLALEIVKKDWRILEKLPEEMQSDEKILECCLVKSNSALKFVPKKYKDSIDFILPFISKNGNLLQYVCGELQNTKSVCLAAVKERGFALRYASATQRNDPDVVFLAVSNDGSALKYASGPIKMKKHIVRAAVQQNSSAFQFADESLRADKDLVLFAVGRNAQNLKYALGGLSQDRECWTAAGLTYSTPQGRKEGGVYIVLSTRFSLRSESQSSVTEFTRLLTAHPYIRDGIFDVYSPNAFEKSTCDPEWTQLDWPCRGTFTTCLMPAEHKTGEPTASSCWRYSYRWHQEEAKHTSGFMLQIVDAFPDDDGAVRYQLGQGQQIEGEMADAIGLKVFKVFQPRVVDVDTYRKLYTHFNESHINALVEAIQKWYEAHCEDSSIQEVLFEESLGDMPIS